MKALRALSLFCVVLLAGLSTLSAQTWTPINNAPPFQDGLIWLLTDGRVLANAYTSTDWYTLTPDINGSYVNGTWTQVASSPATWGALYYAGAVLANGKFSGIGGEYNSGTGGSNAGAEYNPVTDTWKSLNTPPYVVKNSESIADSPGVVLFDGSWMIGVAYSNAPHYSELTKDGGLTWKQTGAGKLEETVEDSFTLLPNGKVLTVDLSIPANSELYDPSSGTWGPGGNTVVDFSANNQCYEIGPSVLRYDGTVLQVGANTHNAVYDSKTGVWSAAPDTPGLAATDGPGAILPNGNVLVTLAPYNAAGGYCYQAPNQYFEWDGTNFNPVPSPPDGGGPSFVYYMLVLPTGEIMQTDSGGGVSFYTTSGTYKPAWAPTITSLSDTHLHPGDLSRKVSGTQFNGFTQGSAFGDDFQNATNYPLVRITNNASGHVFYARTHNHSSMGIATGAEIVSTLFDVPCSTELGASKLVVVTNGIPSNSENVDVVLPNKAACQQ